MNKSSIKNSPTSLDLNKYSGEYNVKSESSIDPLITDTVGRF